VLVKKCIGLAQILDEASACLFAALVVRGAQDRRWVDRRQHRGKVRHVDRLAVILSDAEAAAQQRLGCGSTEAYDQLRLDGFYFGIEPGACFGMERAFVETGMKTGMRLVAVPVARIRFSTPAPGCRGADAD